MRYRNERAALERTAVPRMDAPLDYNARFADDSMYQAVQIVEAERVMDRTMVYAHG